MRRWMLVLLVGLLFSQTVLGQVISENMAKYLHWLNSNSERITDFNHLWAYVDPGHNGNNLTIKYSFAGQHIPKKVVFAAVNVENIVDGFDDDDYREELAKTVLKKIKLDSESNNFNEGIATLSYSENVNGLEITFVYENGDTSKMLIDLTKANATTTMTVTTNK